MKSILITMAALFALSACTPEEIAAVEEHYSQAVRAQSAAGVDDGSGSADTAPVETVPAGTEMYANIVATCDGVDVDISGYPDDTRVDVGIDSQPPGGGFTIVNGEMHAHYSWPDFYTGKAFTSAATLRLLSDTVSVHKTTPLISCP